MKAEDVKTYDDLKLIIDDYDLAHRNLDKEGMKNAVKEFGLGLPTLSLHREDWPEWAVKFAKGVVSFFPEILNDFEMERYDIKPTDTIHLDKDKDTPRQRELLTKWGYEFQEENEKELVFKRKEIN